MKIFVATLLFLATFSAQALETKTACTDFNTQTKIARDAVKALIALAEVPAPTAYYGGVAGERDGKMIVNVQPRFTYTKDWYKVAVRNADCRVMSVDLYAEGLPINDLRPELPADSDECCFHRGADGTCYHPNPACDGCECYHRGADGTCYHCSCPGGCP